MKLQLKELIRRFRVLAFDKAIPSFWADEDVRAWLNDAERQAAIRGRLLPEDSEAAVCAIALQAGQRTYTLHDSVFEIISLRLVPEGGRARHLELKSREWLDARMPDWRDRAEPARFAIQNDTSLRLVGDFGNGDALSLECYRLPLRAMEQPTDTPEIHEAHHEHLVQWALHMAFSIPDTETFDPRRAQDADAAFTRYFGALPDSNLRRITREDQQHSNVVPWP